VREVGVEQAGTSLVFATHAPATVLAEAQQVVCLRDGGVAYAGAVTTLYERPPTAELAGYLGEANWLEPAEARLWLQREELAACCFRPERLAVSPTTEGSLLVEAARFHGAVAEVTVRHAGSGARRRFWHRPSGHHLAPGMRVQVTVV
jgi:ABC-type Fe3+/spermidine/putrescine transport system ATPase subunit